MAYTLQELRQQYPNSLAGLNDADAIYKIAQLTGENPQALAEEYGVIASGQGDFARGISSGADSFQAGLYGLAGWAGEAAGVDKVRDWGYEGYKRNMGEVQLRAKPYDNIEEAESFGDYVDSAQYWVGYAIPQIIGAVVGSKGAGVLTKKALEKSLKKQLKKQYGDLNPNALKAVMSSKATQAKLASNIKKVRAGEFAGIGTQAVGTELGHTYSGAVEEAISKGGTIEDVDFARATKYGLAAGAAEFGADVLTLGLAKLGPAKSLLDPAGKFTSKSRIVNAAVRTPTAAGLEAGTELVQTGLEEMGAGHEFDIDLFKDPTSAWAGAWGGGPMGLAGGLASKKVDPNAKINEALKNAAEDTAEEVDQVDQAQREADAAAEEFEDEIEAQEDLRDAHSQTFPSQKAWEEEQRVEKELVQRAQLQDPNSELSVAFKAWRKQNQIYLSDDPKANEIIIKKFLKKHNTDTTGTPKTQDLRDAHLAALDAHAALQEAKKGRADETQAEIDKALKEFWGRRETAIAEGDTQEVLAIEQEVEALDKALPNEQVMAEWDGTKRSLGNEAALAEAAAAATAEEKAKATEKAAKDAEVAATKAAKDAEVVATKAAKDAEAAATEKAKLEAEAAATEKAKSEAEAQKEQAAAEEAPVEATAKAEETPAEEAAAEEAPVEESAQSVTVTYRKVDYNIDRDGRITNAKTDKFRAKAAFPPSFHKRVDEKFAEIDAKLNVSKEVNPWEDKKYRNVKGKKTINKRWKRWDDAVKEFGEGFDDTYLELRQALFSERLLKDSTYANRLEDARQLQKDREFVKGIIGKEMRVFGQIVYEGEWQRPVMETLMDAAERGALHDYLYHEGGKWKFALSDIAKELGFEEPTPTQRQNVLDALNAFRRKQTEYGELAKALGKDRETVGEFLHRTLITYASSHPEGEITSTAEVEKKVAANELPGMRIQKRISDTGTGKKGEFNLPSKQELSEDNWPIAARTRKQAIEARLELLKDKVPKLKLAATNAEKKAKAYPKNKELQTRARSKRKVATAASNELIGLKQDAARGVYKQERAKLVKKRGKAGTALREANDRLDKARKQKASKKQLNRLKEIVEAKKTKLDQIKADIEGLLSPEEKRKAGVQKKKDIAARKKGELPEGTPPSQSVLRREEKEKAQIERAEQILKKDGAIERVAEQWNIRRSPGMRAFKRLRVEDRYKWTAILVDALEEHDEASLDRLQKSMEGRVKDEDIRRAKAKAKKMAERSSTVDTGEAGTEDTANVSGTEDTEKASKVTLTKKEIEKYASRVLGRTWRTEHTIIVTHLKAGNKAKAVSYIDKVVEQEAKFVGEADKQIPSRRDREKVWARLNEQKVRQATTQTKIENMLRNLLGQKTFDRITGPKDVYPGGNRVFYLTVEEANKRWAGDHSGTRAMVVKHYDDKGESRSPELVMDTQDDGLGDFRERGKGRYNDIIVFFPENIEKGHEASTFMHEIGSHIGLDNILSPSEQAALMTKIKSWAKAYDNYMQANQLVYEQMKGSPTIRLDDIAVGVELALIRGELTSDEVAAGRAMESVRDLEEIGELKTNYPTNVDSQIATRESHKEVKEIIAYFITESIQLYSDTDGEFGTIQSEVKPGSAIGRLLHKFRQAFRELIGYQKGESDNLTGQHILDMAAGAARLELGLKRGYLLGRRDYLSILARREMKGAKVLRDSSMAKALREPTGYVSTMAFMEKKREEVTAQDVTNFRLANNNFGVKRLRDSMREQSGSGETEEVASSFADESVTPYWQKKIDDFVANKIPKNDKNKYITENGQWLEKTEWSQWQHSQGRKEKAMRAGLKSIVEQRQREAQQHADVMNDSDEVLVEVDKSLNPTARKESKEEVDAIRDWIAKTFNPTVVQIYDNMSRLFFAGTGATKFVHQIINDVAALMPEAKAWYDNVLLSEKSRQKIKMLVEDIIVRARELSKPHLDQVNQFIAKSTTEQLWAYNPHSVDDPRHAQVEAQLKDKSNTQQVWLIKQFKGLTKEQQDIIKDVFAHGEAMLARKRAIAKVIFGKGAPDKFFGSSGLTGPYAPLRRFGNYISEFKSQELLDAEEAYAEVDSPKNLRNYERIKKQAKNYRITFHGTIGAAKRDVDENKSKYAHSRAFHKSKNVVETRAPEFKVFQKVLAGLNATDIPRGSPEFKAIEDMVHDMYFDSLDEDNARHSQVKRQGYAGYDNDMLKGFKAHAASEANLIANMEHGKSIYSALAAARKRAHDSENEKLTRVYNLMVSHHTASLDNRQTVFRALQDKVAAINTVYMLTSSIGYHVTNATQVMMVTIPKLVGDFGTGNYGKAIGLYLKGLRIASDVVTFNWKKFKFQTKIDIDKAPKKYRALLEELQLRQLLDVGMDQDLAEFGRADSGFQLVNKANEAASTFSHRLYQVARLVEAYNRISTATAAFELAQDNTSVVTKLGYNNKLTEDNSIQYAIRMVEDTQGNFSSIDAPLILKKMPKVTGQYRKYQIMMAWVYADATKKSFVGASPEEKAAGRRTIGVLLGHAGVFSGAVGIPFSHMIAALFMGIGEGDEPEDLERWIQENIQDETLAKMISHGLPSVFGVDMNTKLSQQKIFSAAPYTDFEMTEDALKAAFFEFLAGPSAATASNMIRSYSYAKEGNAWRAIEYGLPKGVRTAMESYRLSTEGYSLRNGDVVSSPGDFSGWQLVVNALGIPATDIKQMKWKRGQQYELSKWFGDTQSRLRKEYVKAKKEGNSGDVREIIEEWKRLQKSKDRVRPFFNNERSALKKTPLASLFKATKQQLEREAKYLAQLKP